MRTQDQLGLKVFALLAGLLAVGFGMEQIVPARLLDPAAVSAHHEGRYESRYDGPGKTGDYGDADDSLAGFQALLIEDDHAPVARAIDATLRAIPTRQPQWLTNAVEPTNDPGPRIAIIIDDVGLSDFSVSRLAGMAPLTLSILPYADDPQKSAEILSSAGHELMVHLPMEPKDEASDPGPHAIYGYLSDSELNRRIDWNLSQFQGYVGVNNHMGSALTERAAPMARLMVALRRRGLLYVDSLTSPDSISRRAAGAIGVPFLARDIFIDNARDRNLIAAQLDRAERIARQHGLAVAIGHPYEETLDVIEAWRVGAAQRGLVFIPISQAMLEYGRHRQHVRTQTLQQSQDLLSSAGQKASGDTAR